MERALFHQILLNLVFYLPSDLLQQLLVDLNRYQVQSLALWSSV